MSGQYVVLEVLQSLRGRDVTGFWASVDYSAIYFVLHGARKVIVLGPLPSAASCAEENVNISGLTERAKIANTVPGGWPSRVPCNYGIDASVDFLPLSQQCADGTCEVQS